MIFAPSSFIRLSEPISRGTVTGQRNSRTRLRASCPTSRTSEHSRAGARRRDVRMFGCLSLDGPHREGCLLAGLRTHLPLSRISVILLFPRGLYGILSVQRRPTAARPIADVAPARQTERSLTIAVKNLQLSFGSLSVLQGIDLSVTTGVLHALIGPNGAGKSTLVQTLFSGRTRHRLHSAGRRFVSGSVRCAELACCVRYSR